VLLQKDNGVPGKTALLGKSYLLNGTEMKLFIQVIVLQDVQYVLEIYIIMYPNYTIDCKNTA
jgi:hypothetical protein